MATDEDNLGWIDMEMTGLDPASCAVLEVATLVTDRDLNVLAEGPLLAVHQPGTVLSAMDDWNREHHGRSGLLDRVRASTHTLSGAEQETLGFLARWIPPGKSPLCGNSVHQDRRFLHAYMPALDAFFHYRIVDVSTVKELVKRWYRDVPEFPKRKAHLALDDIRESVAELRYYREKVFRSAVVPPAG
jgi:oligoribonuclease